METAQRAVASLAASQPGRSTGRCRGTACDSALCAPTSPASPSGASGDAEASPPIALTQKASVISVSFAASWVAQPMESGFSNSARAHRHRHTNTNTNTNTHTHSLTHSLTHTRALLCSCSPATVARLTRTAIKGPRSRAVCIVDCLVWAKTQASRDPGRRLVLQAMTVTTMSGVNQSSGRSRSMNSTNRSSS